MYLARFVLLWAPTLLAAQQAGTVSPQAGSAPPPYSKQDQPTRPEDLCTVEGQVVNALTGEPVKKVQISMTNHMGRGHANGFGAVTDAGGRFVVENVDPGQYGLSAVRDGFGKMEYGARVPDRPGSPLFLSAGQHVRDIALRLTPQGVIAGRVLDEEGEPVQYAQIQVMGSRSVRGMRNNSGYASTNDLGEYRVFGLQPGKYYLRATDQQQNRMNDAQDRKPGVEAEEGHVPTYFPGSTDPAGAGVIEVAAGTVVSGADVTLRKTRTLRIRGRVVPAAGDGPPPRVMITVLPREPAFAVFVSAVMARTQGTNGTFQVRNLAPGAYLLVADWSEDGKRRVVKQPVDLGSSNLDDFTLLLTPALQLKGQVRVEGTADVNLAQLFVELATQGPMRYRMGGSRVKDDGSFIFENINADNYTLNLRGLPPNFYMKSMRMGDVDALERGLDLTHGPAGSLDVVISPNGGQVEGTVADSKGQMSSGATVVLVPDAPRREQSGLYQIAGTDQSGHFNLQGIAPGDYKLFAWEDADSDSYRDPEFVKQFENAGEAVAIREGGRENRQLKLIPAESTPKSPGN